LCDMGGMALSSHIFRPGVLRPPGATELENRSVKLAIEALRGRAVLGLVGPSRVMWTLDRGRTLPGRG
jgi:hypothetical protein